MQEKCKSERISPLKRIRNSMRANNNRNSNVAQRTKKQRNSGTEITENGKRKEDGKQSTKRRKNDTKAATMISIDNLQQLKLDVYRNRQQA